MEDSMKDRLILILGIICVIFFVGMAGSCSSAARIKAARDKEMSTRLDLEEKMAKTAQNNSAYEDKIIQLTKSLEEEKTAHEATKKALLQQQLMTQSLEEELDKVIKLKETLEENLKEALSGKRKAKR